MEEVIVGSKKFDFSASTMGELEKNLAKDCDDYRTETTGRSRSEILNHWKNFLKKNPQYSSYCVEFLLKKEMAERPGLNQYGGLFRDDTTSLALEIFIFCLPKDEAYYSALITYLDSLTEDTKNLELEDELNVELSKIKKGAKKQNVALKQLIETSRDPLLDSKILPLVFEYLAKINYSPTLIVSAVQAIIGYHLMPVLGEKLNGNQENIFDALGYSNQTKTVIETEFKKFQQINETLKDLQQKTQQYLDNLADEINADTTKIYDSHEAGEILYQKTGRAPEKIEKIMGVGIQSNTVISQSTTLKDSINQKIELYRDVSDLLETLSDKTNPESSSKTKLQNYATKLFGNYGNKEKPSLAEKIEKHSGNRAFVNGVILAVSFLPIAIPAAYFIYYRWKHHRFPWEKEGKSAVNEAQDFRQPQSRKPVPVR